MDESPEEIETEIDEFCIGQATLDFIVESQLVSVEGGGVVFVWSANSAEQLGAYIEEYVSFRVACEVDRFAEEVACRHWNQVGDWIHDVASGYGRLLFPWFGKWVMVTAAGSIRWTRGMEFHNCTATGRV